MSAQRPAGPHYRVEAAEPAAHLYHVTLTVAQPEAAQRVSLPAWIPGSYLVREFSRHLQKLAARQGGKPVTIHQLDKATWQVDCAPSAPLVLTYEVYAFDNSVRTAWLDMQRGFFNGTSLCLKVHAQEHLPHALELVALRAFPHWEAATGLEPLKTGKRGFGTYLAADYDELVDCPVELGPLFTADFRAGGVPHRVVVAGTTEAFDGDRLVADMQKICEAQVRFWHDRRRPPFKSYLFMLNAVDEGYGGLEHRNSTALIASRRDLPRRGEARASDGYV
ncbi:MAG: peptidase M61, partial [Comamonadaceae bacterium]